MSWCWQVVHAAGVRVEVTTASSPAQHPTARAATKGSPAVRCTAAKTAPETAIVVAPPRASAMESAAELNPRSEAPDSPNMDTLVLV